MTCSVITHPACALHDLPGHPESQERIAIACSGVPAGTPRREARMATIEEIRRVHLPGHIALVQNACDCCPDGDVRFLDPDTYITRDSYEIARYAAGAAVQAVEQALGGTHTLSLMRPPGHHALPNHSMGFCIFNNPSIAAAAALTSVDRVAIVDWDVHHGNGTQYIWYHTDRVLYLSVHHGGIFPGSGMPWETGVGPGEGYSINAPLEGGSTGADYAHVFTNVFLPAIVQYRPEALIISAGQDSLHDDMLGGMALFPRDFGMFTTLLTDAVRLPAAILLEGGYSPSAGEAIRAIIDALGGSRYAVPAGAPHPATVSLVRLLAKRND
ncbi:MAG: histone deacetylase [Methanomicrobiaceae archaeon]|nr:histone deacetylase [Methanomicrobiaceae archaeon]